MDTETLKMWALVVLVVFYAVPIIWAMSTLTTPKKRISKSGQRVLGEHELPIQAELRKTYNCESTKDHLDMY